MQTASQVMSSHGKAGSPTPI